MATDAAGSARSSKKRKIEEISHADENASSPSQSRKKLLRQSPSKEELASSSEAKEEFVSLPSVYLKPASSQDASAQEAPLNMDSLKQALPDVVTAAPCDD